MRFTMPHLLKPSDILAMAKMPADQDRAEVRIYAAAVTIILILGCFSPALFIVLDPVSDLARQTRVSQIPGAVVALSFCIAAILAIPHAITLVMLPQYLKERWPRLCAVWGACIAGFTWLYLGATVEPLDFGDPPWAYWLKSILCALVAAIYAYSLNNQALRENVRSVSVD